jgi:hypothetical protein
MTWRLVKNLVDQLPPESATKTAARDSLTDEQLADLLDAEKPSGHGQWSHIGLLIAAVFDVLQQIRHVLIVANGGTSDIPKQLPRPGVERPRRRITTAGREHLAQMAADHEKRRREASDGRR